MPLGKLPIPLGKRPWRGHRFTGHQLCAGVSALGINPQGYWRNWPSYPSLLRQHTGHRQELVTGRGAIIMADEAVLELVRQHMRSVRVPGHHDKVRPVHARCVEPHNRQRCLPVRTVAALECTAELHISVAAKMLRCND